MGLGWTEWIVILLIVVLLFGARKLPELAHSMGASVQSFKKGMREGADEANKPKEKDAAGPSSHSTNGSAH